MEVVGCGQLYSIVVPSGPCWNLGKISGRDPELEVVSAWVVEEVYTAFWETKGRDTEARIGMGEVRTPNTERKTKKDPAPQP